MTHDDRQALSQRQRDALWTWTWLGWRESTPGFKVAMALLGVASVALAILGFR